MCRLINDQVAQLGFCYDNLLVGQTNGFKVQGRENHMSSYAI